MWVTVALVVAVVVILVLRANTRPPGLPPGPFAFPVFGNALTVFFRTPKEAFKRYAKDYGGIVSLKIFDQWSVLVSDPSLMRAGLGDPATAGRIELLLFNKRDEIITGRSNAPPLGILSTNGDVWRNQRRFTLRTLKDLGFGRNSLEPIMQEELEELLMHLKQRQGEKVDVGLLFNRSIINVLWAITIGKRYSYDDRKLEKLVEKVNKMFQTFNPFHPALRFKWVKKLFPNLSIIKETEGYMTDILTFIEGEIEDYKKEMNGQVDTGSYIGAYLHEIEVMEKEKKKEKEEKEKVEEEKEEEEDGAALSLAHLKANILELFLGGSETTSSTLWWAVYLLASNPGPQRAMQEEMDRVVGPENMPTIAHMDKLTYTMATIYEVQRVGDLVPIGLPHLTTEDVTLAGYRIPKGTGMTFNLSYALSDPKYWKEPEKFSPDHFLTEDGKLFKPDQFMPFGSGKRVCLGESLARLEVFVFLASLMHRFSWRLTQDPITWEHATVLSRPPNFTVYADLRHKKETKQEEEKEKEEEEEDKKEEEKHEE